MQIKNGLETRTGTSAQVSSRRRFMRAAAITGGTGLLAAGPMPISAQESAKNISRLALSAATKDVTPFKGHVQQAALDDLKRRLAATRGPGRENVGHSSHGRPLPQRPAPDS